MFKTYVCLLTCASSSFAGLPKLSLLSGCSFSELRLRLHAYSGGTVPDFNRSSYLPASSFLPRYIKYIFLLYSNFSLIFFLKTILATNSKLVNLMVSRKFRHLSPFFDILYIKLHFLSSFTNAPPFGSIMISCSSMALIFKSIMP